MKSVVITGSTRGIGFGLAREFLARGHAVTISGRTAEGVKASVAELSVGDCAARAHGAACDVTNAADVQGLWDAAVMRFDRVDVWINNAGITHAPVPFAQLSARDIESTVDVNMRGMLLGCHVALRGMAAQAGGGALFNMEGFGSNGMKREGMSVYGATKAGLRYFTESLTKEAQATAPNVLVGAMSPGIVATDLLLAGYADYPERWEKAKKFLAIAADKVETVTPYLVEHALATTKTGARIEWLTPGRMLLRFAAAPFVTRDVIPS